MNSPPLPTGANAAGCEQVFSFLFLWAMKVQVTGKEKKTNKQETELGLGGWVKRGRD